jgi:hypothetical protein
MKIVEDFTGHYPDALERYNNFPSAEDEDTIFFNGMGCMTNPVYRTKYMRHKRKLFFNYEQPCAWYGDLDYASLSANHDGFFDKVFTVCPYSAEWLNSIYNNDCFATIFFPFNEEFVIPPQPKIYETLFWGHIHHPIHANIVKSIAKFNHNFITLGQQYWNSPDPQCSPLITHTNINRLKLWDILRKTKINIILNAMFLTDASVAKAKRIPHWESNKTNSYLDKGVVPQLKTRAIESAFNRCLMLVRRDDWNVIELWFKPDEDFIYYSSEEELPDKINHILNNWEDYQPCIDRAFEKAASRYTTRHFLDIIKRNANV